MTVNFGPLARRLPKELPPRLNALLAVLTFALWIVMFRYWEMDKSFSAHTLLIGVGVVIAIGCLIYTPPRLLLWLVMGAAGTPLIYVAKGMRDWQVLAGLIAICFLGVVWCIDKAANLILKRLGEIEGRVHSVEAKLNYLVRSLKRDKARAEAKQMAAVALDELTAKMSNPSYWTDTQR